MAFRLIMRNDGHFRFGINPIKLKLKLAEHIFLLTAKIDANASSVFDHDIDVRILYIQNNSIRSISIADSGLMKKICCTQSKLCVHNLI